MSADGFPNCVSPELRAEIRAAKTSDIARILDIQAKAGLALPGANSLEKAIDDDTRLVVVHTTQFDGGAGALMRAHRPKAPA